MPVNPSEHPITPGYRWLSLVVGVGVAIFSGVGLMKTIEDPPVTDIGMVIASVMWLLVGLCGFWPIKHFFTANRYTVHLSEFGIRVGPEGKWVTWSEIVTLRERLFLQRLDLIDSQGRLLAAVEYQVRDSSSVVQHIRERVRDQRAHEVPAQRRFGNWRLTMAALLLLNVVVIAFFLIMWISDEERPLWFLVLAAAFLVWLNIQGSGDMVQLDVLDDELMIRYAIRGRYIHRDDVAAVQFELEGKSNMEVKVERCFIVLTDGTWLPITTGGSDQETIYRVLAWWHERDQTPARAHALPDG